MILEREGVDRRDALVDLRLGDGLGGGHLVGVAGFPVDVDGSLLVARRVVPEDVGTARECDRNGCPGPHEQATARPLVAGRPCGW